MTQSETLNAIRLAASDLCAEIEESGMNDRDYVTEMLLEIVHLCQTAERSPAGHR